jgi:hypothetical protein
LPSTTLISLFAPLLGEVGGEPSRCERICIEFEPGNGIA